MDERTLLANAQAILSQPTAPFHEDAVRAEIERLLAPLPHVHVERDDFGNVIAHYRNGPSAPRYAFAVHMDHPGYVGEKFMGGVPERYRVRKPPTRDFGRFAMWDLPAFEHREGRIYSRACDDLVGCAAVVSTLQELERLGAETSCYGLFTRAEEVGFIGAIQLARAGLVPKDVTIVSLETSSERGGPVKMGEGLIVRVGDKTSVFDSSATATLTALAKEHKLPFQRSLMSGGTCEGTAYQLYGYRCGALCVALGNYHNCGPEDRIEMEYVSLSDYTGMTQLCVAAAQANSRPDANEELRARLESEMEEYRAHF